MQPVKDKQTVMADGTPLAHLPDGMSIRDAVLHTDDRGSLCEMYDPRWGFSDEPLVFAYFCTIRPGVVKGWAMHERHEDRYFLMSGVIELVLYDAREDSPTHGLVSKVYLSDQRRQLVNIPSGVWHADHNVGTTDAVIVNFPTIQYDHDAPDKFRLPLDTDEIPYTFENARGW